MSKGAVAVKAVGVAVAIAGVSGGAASAAAVIAATGGSAAVVLAGVGIYKWLSK